MLTIYRRHRAECKFKGRRAKCFCPIWAQGVLHGEKIRQSLDLTNWEAANKRVWDWEIHGRRNSLSLLDACDRFIANGVASGLSADTIKKYKLLKREFEAFFGDIPPRAISLDDLSRFRESWTMSNVTARKKIERLRSFFRFCLDRDWVAKNPAAGLKLPKENHLPTLPFTKDEWEKILWAVDLYPERPVGRRDEVRAFVLLLRYTGLRIRDAVCLERNRIADGRIFLYTQKTGTPVLMPLALEVINAFGRLPAAGQYFFWSGAGNAKSAVGDWQRTLRKLFTLAGVVNGHAHRFRDTFAVGLLQHGVSLENVAVLLGNTARIAERHYAPWVKSRQDALEQAVRATW
ncbi:MAG TPA: tyrosine-type recombinase/integrase [Bryobacteraceae bacterium]